MIKLDKISTVMETPKVVTNETNNICVNVSPSSSRLDNDKHTLIEQSVQSVRSEGVAST